MVGRQRKHDKGVSLPEMARSISEGLTSAAVRPNLWGYKPHEKQEHFHKSESKARLYVGGNRSGKTTGGIIEDIWWLMGEHPYKEVPPAPVRGRIVGVDYENGIERILKPEMARWIPPSLLINGSWTDSYFATTRTLTLANGSFVEFMSYVQDLAKFAGTSRHFVHYDEEPPKSIFVENKMRLVDTGGSWWATMTPVEGMTWVYDEIYIPGTTDPHGSGITVIEVDMTENPYLNLAEIEAFLSGLDEQERAARKEGKFVQIGGLIFKRFNPAVHVVDPPETDSIKRWRWYVSLDHGFNNPSAWLWHAVSPSGRVITFFEHHEAEWTVEQHAERVHQINKELGREPDLYIGDPAIKQRAAQTGLSIQVAYMQCGIPIVLANNDVRSSIDRINQYFKANYWQISMMCPNTINQVRRYRWKTWESSKLRDKNNPYEEPHKKDDHCVDSSRYFFSFMPSLKQPEEMRVNTGIGPQIEQMMNARTPVDMAVGATDTNFSPAPNPQTEWTYIEETLGGIW